LEKRRIKVYDALITCPNSSQRRFSPTKATVPMQSAQT
jgi:hypothetical protein